ncbi:hypothetical protein BVY03_03680 [bacterium K02(2017)]|nr:hypothetical protein BVY03_03680 [bacterium K02(2017)]
MAKVIVPIIAPTTVAASITPPFDATLASEKLSQLKKQDISPSDVYTIKGAITDQPNAWSPSEGIRHFPTMLKETDFFKRIHPDKNINNALTPIQRIETIEHITGVQLFKTNSSESIQQSLNNLRDDLSDEDILTVLEFFGEMTISEEGRQYLVEQFKKGWDAEFLTDENGQAIPFDFDMDDTRITSWHMAKLGFATAFNHFVLKDKPSTFFKIGQLMEEGAKKVYAWGGYTMTTQVRPQAFFIARLLRHDQKLSLFTNSDRSTIYRLTKHFPNFRAALLGLLPYQEPQRQDVLDNTENIYTLKDHARQIRLLTKILKKHHFNSDKDTKFFDSLSPELKVEVAIRIFGRKSYKTKSAVLQNLDEDGIISISSPATIDNDINHALVALKTGLQHFLHVHDYPRKPIPLLAHFSSNYVFTALGKQLNFATKLILKLSPKRFHTKLAIISAKMNTKLQQRNTLNQMPAESYSDTSLLEALEKAVSIPPGQLITVPPVGLSGIIIQRAINFFIPYSDFITGTEINKKDAKQAIKELKQFFVGLGESSDIFEFYRDLIK